MTTEKPAPEVPVGLENLLSMAAAHEPFAEALLADRERVQAVSGVEIAATEGAILRSIDKAALRSMINQMRSCLPQRDRRAFLERASVALVALVGGGALAAAAGCEDKTKSSARSATTPPTQPPDGIPPQMSRPRPEPDHPRDTTTTGSRPDYPERPVSIGRTGSRPSRPPTRDAGVPSRPRPMYPKPTRGHTLR